MSTNVHFHWEGNIYLESTDKCRVIGGRAWIFGHSAPISSEPRVNGEGVHAICSGPKTAKTRHRKETAIGGEREWRAPMYTVDTKEGLQ